MFMFEWSALITLQKATLDIMRTLTRFVSYRRLSHKFQFSLSPAALGIYLYVPIAKQEEQLSVAERNCKVRL